MSINDRLKRNKGGDVFIPMNVEGGAWEENFLSSTKAIALVLMLLGDLLIFGMGANNGLSAIGWLLYIAFIIFIDQLIIRYIIFEEKYFHKMYVKMKDHEVTTPGVFWSIPYIRQTSGGSVLIYADTKVGVIVKLERDTIVGRNEQFEENHFDALSDFYKELNLRDLRWVQMNLMERAGNDPRISKLDEVTRKAKNKNVAKLLDMQLGYVKKITRETLYESDYILVYANGMQRRETVLDEVVDCVYKALDGAFTGYRVLDKKELIDFCKDFYNVKYIDIMDATLRTVRNDSSRIGIPAKITIIRKDDGSEISVDNDANFRLLKLASVNSAGDVKIDEEALNEAIMGIQNKNKNTKNNEQQLGFIDGKYSETQEYDEYASVKDFDTEISGIDNGERDSDVYNEDSGEKNKRRKKEKKSKDHVDKKRFSIGNKNQQKNKVNDDSDNKPINDDEIIDF